MTYKSSPQKLTIDSILFLSLLLITLSSCSKLDKNKFKNLYHAITTIKVESKQENDDNQLNKKLLRYEVELERIDQLNLKNEELELYNLFSEYLNLQKTALTIRKLNSEYTPVNFPSSYIILSRFPLTNPRQDKAKDKFSSIDKITLLTLQYKFPIYKINWEPPSSEKNNSIFDGAFGVQLDSNGVSNVYERGNYKAVNRFESSKIILVHSEMIYERIKRLYNK